MDWQQKVFRNVIHWAQSLVPSSETANEQKAMLLQSIKPRLVLLARLLTGEAIEIMTAEHEGGCSGTLFFLPKAFSLGESPEENLQFYLFRVAYLSIQFQLGLNWPDKGEYTIAESRAEAQKHSGQILATLFAEFPTLLRTYDCLLKQIQNTPSPEENIYLAYGHWMPPLHDSSAKVGLPDQQTPDLNSSDPETVLEAPAREQIDILEEDREAIKNYTLQHYFEKVETLEEFQGTWRDTDGGDDLSDHAEALKELDLRQVMRSDDPVHSVFQTEFLPGSSAPESRDVIAKGYYLSYDEWDQKKKKYHTDFCRVYPTISHEKNAQYVHDTLSSHRATLQQLRHRFGQLFNSLEQVRFQTHGEEIDLDRMVEHYAERRAGVTPDERVYLSRRKRRRDSSILLLMDLSLSTDGYTGGERIIDVEKQAVILFSELLSEYGDRFRIDGFSSRTRHHCDYLTFKDFDEPWIKAASRIGAAEPAGYTRIGPALRHATELLRQEDARSRWIILLSDGKPNDYDRYEGNYGLSDVKQAIREARREQIQIYGLAVEAQARYYLPLMLGQGAYRILHHPRHLPEALAEFYGKLIRQ